MVKWYEVHEQLSGALVTFYDNCIIDRKNPEKTLYQLLTSNSRFLALNQWIEKFSQQFGVESLDPMHVFFSLHPNKMTFDNRQKRAELLYELLLNKSLDNEIDFSGCPAPAIIHILSARAEQHQKEIWDVFMQVKKSGRKGLTPSDFLRYKTWYGIEFKSFTTFLFYIDSDHFLPMESNVEDFIIKIRLMEAIQKKYDDYIGVLHKIDPFNNSQDRGYGPNGVFREISFWAYKIAREEIPADSYSEGIDALIRSVDRNTAEPISLLTESEIDFQFRLIAIRPLFGCHSSILNNLHIDQLYYFEKTIDIGTEIRYFPERSLQLFQPEKLPRLNVTAIVGKNGSGKSSLIELLFRIINNISYVHADHLGTDDMEFIPALFAELYYVYKSHLYKLELKGEEIFIEQFGLKEGSYHLLTRAVFTQQHFNRFFYTIAVNYSHYALNAKEIGTWINGLFHKNDGYQTPIAINPMRTDGNIDINKENSLTTSRLISLLLAPVDENSTGLRQVTDKQKAVEIKVSLKKEQEFILFETATSEKIKLGQLKTNQDKIFKIISDAFGLEQEITGTELSIKERLKQYMICKLVRMALNYYSGHDFFDLKKIKFRSLKDVKTLVNKIKINETHSAYKFNQAINYWKHNLWPKTDSFVIDISKDGDRANNFLGTVENGKLIKFIPPSIFDFEIILENTDKSKSSFIKLSSGEKQLVYSVSSLLYHLNNIDSVHYADEYIAYDTVNIVLDEIELYYHPEWQKRYVNFLLTHISNFELPNIRAVNICFVTHSPYILSDIPDNYTLKLRDEKLRMEASRTFAANIHDLLANDFFLEDGFMGEFAKKKINEIIRYLNIQSVWKRLREMSNEPENSSADVKRTALFSELALWKLIGEVKPTEENAETIEEQEQKRLLTLDETERLIKEQNFMDQEAYRKIIEAIGEPILRHKLLDMFHDVFGKEEDDEEKTNQFLRLASELNYKVSKN